METQRRGEGTKRLTARKRARSKVAKQAAARRNAPQCQGVWLHAVGRSTKSHRCSNGYKGAASDVLDIGLNRTIYMCYNCWCETIDLGWREIIEADGRISAVSADELLPWSLKRRHYRIYYSTPNPERESTYALTLMPPSPRQNPDVIDLTGDDTDTEDTVVIPDLNVVPSD